jgi:outer membrane lipoprotein-sorting protein
MVRTVALLVVTAFLAACAAAEAVGPGEARPAVAPAVGGTTGAEGELDAFLARLDKRQAPIERLSADITATNREDPPWGRESQPRSGRIYIRKPHDIHIDFTEPRARKIWISERQIVDYKPSLSTAEKVILAEDAGGPEIIGLSATFAELRERFDFALEKPGEKARFYTLTLTPKAEVEADFTEAKIEIDAQSLLPARIIQRDANLGMTKTFALSNIEENPRLSADLFEPKLRNGTDVAEYKLGDWKGL